MSQNNQRVLSREVEATIVPYGDAITIPEGSSVTITHRLGGNFTVMWERGMARITGEFADALGEEAEVQETDSNEGTSDGPPDTDALWAALKSVYDPEIPVNIVDLGLIYTVDVKDGEDGKYKVNVSMTLTAPGCGMGPAIAQDAEYRLKQVPGVSEAEVDLVWDPPWNQNMISEEGKMELGLI